MCPPSLARAFLVTVSYRCELSLRRNNGPRPLGVEDVRTVRINRADIWAFYRPVFADREE
jgi:hypothetical protein